MTLDDLGVRIPELARTVGLRGRIADLYGVDGAAVYHDLTIRVTAELPELLRAVRLTTGPLLELAAGSGRITLPLLALRRPVTAVERSAEMAEVLRTRLADVPASLRALCDLRLGDMTQFALEGCYGAVVLGTRSISLLDRPGREGLYRCALAHLAPEGRLLLTTSSGSVAEVGSEPVTTEMVGDSGRRYRLTEYLVEADARLVAIEPEQAGRAETQVFASMVRNLPADVLCAELAGAGFMVSAQQVIGRMVGGEHVLLTAEAAR